MRLAQDIGLPTHPRLPPNCNQDAAIRPATPPARTWRKTQPVGVTALRWTPPIRNRLPWSDPVSEGALSLGHAHRPPVLAVPADLPRCGAEMKNARLQSPRHADRPHGRILRSRPIRTTTRSPNQNRRSNSTSACNGSRLSRRRAQSAAESSPARFPPR